MAEDSYSYNGASVDGLEGTETEATSVKEWCDRHLKEGVEIDDVVLSKLGGEIDRLAKEYIKAHFKPILKSSYQGNNNYKSAWRASEMYLPKNILIYALDKSAGELHGYNHPRAVDIFNKSCYNIDENANLVKPYSGLSDEDMLNCKVIAFRDAIVAGGFGKECYRIDFFKFNTYDFDDNKKLQVFNILKKISQIQTRTDYVRFDIQGDKLDYQISDNISDSIIDGHYFILSSKFYIDEIGDNRYRMCEIVLKCETDGTFQRNTDEANNIAYMGTIKIKEIVIVDNNNGESTVYGFQ